MNSIDRIDTLAPSYHSREVGPFAALSPPKMPSTPKRSSVIPRSLFSSLLSELRAVRTELADLKTHIPICIAAELVKSVNRRKLVVSGLGEGTTRAKVSSILSLVGVPPDSVLTVIPLGRPVSGSPRPLCVELSSEAAMPHFKTLATLLKTSPAFSHCSVRRYEDPKERHRLYLERVSRRVQQSTPINMSVTSWNEESPAAPEVARTVPIDEPLMSPSPSPKLSTVKSPMKHPAPVKAKQLSPSEPPPAPPTDARGTFHNYTMYGKQYFFPCRTFTFEELIKECRLVVRRYMEQTLCITNIIYHYNNFLPYWREFVRDYLYRVGIDIGPPEPPYRPCYIKYKHIRCSDYDFDGLF